MPLLTIPSHIIDHVLLRVAASEQDPTALYHSALGALRRTCTPLYRALSPELNTALYADLFVQRYPDAEHLRRRIQLFSHPTPALSVPLAAELARRINIERVFRAAHASGSLADTRLPAAFCDAYVMARLDPRALPALRAARAYEVARAWVRERLYDGAEGGWPRETETNAFALALFVMLTTRNTLTNETGEEHAEIMTQLAPIAYAACRYPWSSLAEHSFQPTGASSSRRPPSWASSSDPVPTWNRAEHAPWPPPALPPKTIKLAWLGDSTVEIDVPPMALSAIPAYVMRQGTTPLPAPPNCPRTLAEALASDSLCFSLEEIEDYNHISRLNLPAEEDGPAEPDPTVDAPLSVSNFGMFGPPHVLGSLTGMFYGSYTHHTHQEFAGFNATAMPSPFPSPIRRVMRATLREHYAFSPSGIVSLPLDKDGISNGWIPKDYSWRETGDSLEVFDAQGSLAASYITYHPTRERDPGCNLRALGVLDILVTGETGEEDRAWTPKRFYGRVSMIDGRVTLVAEQTTQGGADRWIFRGRVLPSGMFTGRMIMGGLTTGMSAPTLDIPFCLSRA